MLAASKGKAVPRILCLAREIERDIRKRKLKPGDSYLTTPDTARMLGVSTASANRALQILVKQRVLERRQRRGCVIAAAAALPASTPITRVNLLVPEDYYKKEGILADGLVVGLQEALPGVDLQISFAPPIEDGHYAAALADEALRSRGVEAFVLARSSLSVQRSIRAVGLPAVVWGSVYPSVRGLAWVERDLKSAAQLLTEHLVRRGCRRVVLMGRQTVTPGDHLFLDAVRDTMERLGAGAGALTVRGFPFDREALLDGARGVLRETPGRVGLLCRSEPIAAACAEAARELGKSHAIAVSDVYRKEGEPPPAWPYIRTRATPEELGRTLGSVLSGQALGRGDATVGQIIPVVLQHPEGER